MKTKLVPDQILDLLKRNRHAYQAARKVRMRLGSVVPPRRLPGIPGRVHFNDFMLDDTSPEAAASYLLGAQNVIALIEESLSAAGKDFDDPQSWLDFGCGYGRVLRLLVDRVDPARISASDVIAEGVAFCSEEFGVNPLYSRDEIAELRLGSFDVVYAISVLTHVNEENSIALLRLLGEALNPGGILLFTTHGNWSIENAEFYGESFGRMKGEIGRRVGETGIAFVPYGYYPDDSYGLTWQSERYIVEQMDELHGSSMERLFFQPHGLDGHQDVYAFRRVAKPS